MRFSTQRLLLMQTCVLGCAETHKAATHRRARLMNRQTRELALLCIIAATSGMLAWAFDQPLFVAVFTAETVWAFFMGVYLSLPPD